jgi:phosphatidylserine/phosphatidylglycerophosphate/cardiolipin synthase-like enzyme
MPHEFFVRDWSFCGSFNLSRSGERNAEDMLEIHDASLAEEPAAFVDGVRARYPRMRLEDGPARHSGDAAL